MDTLPLEIIATISEHLEPSDFTAFESVNRALRHSTEQILADAAVYTDEDGYKSLDARYDRSRRRACLGFLVVYIRLPKVLNDHDNETEFEHKASKNNEAFTDKMLSLMRLLHSWEHELESSIHLIVHVTAPGIPADFDGRAWDCNGVPNWMRDPRVVKSFLTRGQSLKFSGETNQQIPSLGCIKSFSYQGYLLDPETLRSLLRSMRGFSKLRLCMDSRVEQTKDSPMKYRDALERALNAAPFSSVDQFALFCHLGKSSTTAIEKDSVASPRNADPLSLALRRISQLPSMELFNLNLGDHALGIEFFSAERAMGTEIEIWPRLKWYTIRFGSMTIDRQAYYNDMPCPHKGYMDENPTGPLRLLSTHSHLLTPLLTSIFLAMRSMPALESFDLNIGTRVDVQFRDMICWRYLPSTLRKTDRAMRTFDLTAAILLALPVAQAQVPDIAGFSKTWFDDFTGSRGALPSSGNWIIDTGTSYPGGPANWGTGEVQTYTNSPSNVATNGQGNLVITAIKDAKGAWTSARIETKQTFMAPAGKKMRVQASLKLPNLGGGGIGYWPAFWTLGAAYRGNYWNWPSVGEIDIMENVNNVNRVWAVLHCGTNPGGPCNEPSGLGNSKNCLATSSCSGVFRTYAVEVDRTKSPEAIRWYVNDQLLHSVTQTQLPAAVWANTTQKAHFVLLNMAMGGSFPDAIYGSKTPIATTVSGGTLEAQYVAVYYSK
ncbi:hypothetical protein CGMCC3_g8579 [Colletotrichum fructicola]|uniref:Beta-glucanase n=2 Tax=Colletotrichum fructicola (strain Nara gc5) TaxID=1213859 RepID=A0A7J6IM15_COLFN|nr:uncharacterized protein CGMCC3_g8579 [Colletotrichum fructicola]KAE9575206.1 hypothetical protein CGMCC3_g8579 [Colletotrichum fructicola]KAF4477800.1 Beta-glucanase [Colletotrichum fructicola Nara gc5]KAF5492877.1 Beta-glucanase [Colletotrichum fructicola]